VKWLGVWLSFALFPAPLVAQQDSVTVRGTVVDRGTDTPIAGAYIAFGAEHRGWTVAATLCRFILVPHVRGHQTLLVTCPRPRGVWGESLDTVAIDLHAPLDTTLVVSVTGSLCDLPAFAERHLDLSGFYSLGFEENRFFPDPDTLGRPLIWGGNPASGHAEVTWSAAGLAQRPPWPAQHGAKRSSSYCLRVRWVGTLTGPGAKDSVGRIAAFTFVVDSTISVASAPAANCGLR
jgi:hypothetical protein